MTDTTTPGDDAGGGDLLLAEKLETVDTKRRAYGLLGSMTWSARAAASWMFIVVFLAAFADFLPFIKDPLHLFGVFDGDPENAGPSGKFWLGTDNLARDMFSRLVYGARVSLAVALTAVGFGIVVGGFLGSLVGFVKGKTETIVMALVDVILAFPGLVLLLVLISITEKRSLFVISLVVGLLSIPPYTRVSRANALSVANREYVEAARAIGTKPGRILFREIIPNVLPSLFAYAMVAAAFIMVLEGSLAFLGLSVQPPTPSWGQMIFQARADMRQNVWPVVYPSLALVFTVLSLNILGDWLRQRNTARSAAL